MRLHNRLQRRPALTPAILLAISPVVMAAAPQAYCSNQNTGADFYGGGLRDRYQSMGNCMGICNGSNYAFAILQGFYCWCSNYIPAQQSSTSSCDATCPGYPSDYCGNQRQGLFGYIALGPSPSGTSGASAQPQSTSQPQSSSPPSSPTPTSYPPASTSSVPPPPPPASSSAAPSTSATLSSSSEPSSDSPTPVVHTSIITRSGSVVTQTVTTTPVVIGGDSQASQQMQRKGLSSGAVAGVVIGALLGLAALLFAAFLIWRRKKNADAEDQPSGAAARPKRTTSVLSRTGLLSRGRPTSMVEHHPENDPYAVGHSNRHSMMLGAGATIEPSSPLGGSQDNISSRRHSRPMVYDQRLNPSALFANPEANGSRVSMQDQQDYSRPLGIANPDFRASFDSR